MLARLYSKSFKLGLQQYVNRKCPDVQAGFRKGRGTRDQIANIYWIIEKAREFQENITDYAKAFVWITANCGKFLEMGIPDHLTCLMRNLYAGQEATVRMLHEQIGKGVHTGFILSSYIFNLYAESKCESVSCSVVSNSF